MVIMTNNSDLRQLPILSLTLTSMKRMVEELMVTKAKMEIAVHVPAHVHVHNKKEIRLLLVGRRSLDDSVSSEPTLLIMDCDM